MFNASSPFLNYLFLTVDVGLFILSLRVLDQMHHLAVDRSEILSAGGYTTTRRIPYSAQVGTMLFAFGALVDGAIRLLILFMPEVVLTSDRHMSPSLLALVSICKMSLLGGGLAAASHKKTIYIMRNQTTRRGPPGKAAGRLGEPEPYLLDESEKARQDWMH